MKKRKRARARKAPARTQLQSPPARVRVTTASCAAPSASRPHMPGYGVVDAAKGKGLLPWSWAARRLVKSHNYWIATTRPDRRAHVMPVWGVWMDDRFYFSTGENSRKARNLAANPACVLCAEQAREPVIVEGTAHKLADDAIPKQAAALYYAKYKWKLDPKVGPVFVITPKVVFGFIEASDDFYQTATRWTFS